MTIGPDRCGQCGIPKTRDSDFEVVQLITGSEFRCQECFEGEDE